MKKNYSRNFIAVFIFTSHLLLLIKTRLVLMLIFIVSTSYFASAQAPQGINYQAVARDAGGNPLVSTGVAIHFSVYNSVGPDSVWIETHSKTTNQFGLFTAIIG